MVCCFFSEARCSISVPFLLFLISSVLQAFAQSHLVMICECTCTRIATLYASAVSLFNYYVIYLISFSVFRIIPCVSPSLFLLKPRVCRLFLQNSVKFCPPSFLFLKPYLSI